MKLLAPGYLLKITAPLALALVLCFSGCKKDKPVTANKSLTGTWKIVTDFPNTFGNYYLFTADGKIYKCSSDDNNMRFLQQGVYAQSGSLVVSNVKDSYGSPVTDLWLVEFSNDTLYLHDNDPYSDIVLIRDLTGPATADDWAKQVTVVARYAAEQEPRGLAYSQGKLYFNVNGFSNKTIYKVSAVSGAVVDSITPPNAYGGIEMNNGRMYVSYGAKVIELNVATGTELTASPDNTDGANLGFLGSNGLQIYAEGYNYLYAYQPGTNSFYYGINRETSGFRDLAYADNYLYIVNRSCFHKCTESLFVSKRSYYVPDFDLIGLAFDGTYYWCSGKNTLTDKWELLKMQL